MSLSELCRLPVSNLRLSAHISAPWTRKKNMSKRQQSLTRKPRSGRTEAFALLFCFLNSALSAHAGRGLKENRAPAPCRVCGLQRPARCQAPSCENRIVVCAAESAAAQAFAKSACLALTFTSAFCH